MAFDRAARRNLRRKFQEQTGKKIGWKPAAIGPHTEPGVQKVRHVRPRRMTYFERRAEEIAPILPEIRVSDFVAPDLAEMGGGSLMVGFQESVTETVREVFGAAGVASKEERALRFLEEALELVQACGVKDVQVCKMVAYVYSRDVGAVPQELAGTNVCLNALASAHGEDLKDLTIQECMRILAKKDACRHKHANKPAEIVADGVR